MEKDFLPKTHFEKFSQTLNTVLTADYFKSVDTLNEHKFVSDETLLGVYSKLLKPQYKYILDMESESENITTITLLYHSYWFYRDKKVFKFEKEITNLLIETPLKKVDVDFIRSPYQSVYLSIPHNTEMLINNLDTGKHVVEGIYVICIRYFDLEGRTTNVPPDTKVILRCMAVGRGKPNESALGEDDDAIMYNTLFLKEGDIFEQVEKSLKEKSKFLIGDDVENHRKINSFIVNALLYITSVQARLDFCQAKLAVDYQGNKPKQLRVAEKANRNLSLLPFCKVGKGIVIKPPQDVEEIDTKTGNKIMFSFKVRPHWHTYRVGPGREKSELRFLMEYVKGKDFSEVIEHAQATVK